MNKIKTHNNMLKKINGRILRKFTYYLFVLHLLPLALCFCLQLDPGWRVHCSAVLKCIPYKGEQSHNYL